MAVVTRAPLPKTHPPLAPLDAALIDALRRLSAGDRALLELSHRRGIPDDEIATLLGLTADEVEVRRERLLKCVAADLEADAPPGLEQIDAVLREPDGKVWIDDRNGKTTAADGRLEERAPAVAAPQSAPGPPRRHRFAGWAGRAPAAALLLLPGGLTAYLGFNAGGFFPGGTAGAAVVVCVALVLRMTLADDPLAGLGRLGLAAIALLAGFAAWTLLSGEWSDAPARALIESDRALLYLVVCLLFATVPRSSRTLRVMLWGFAGAAAVVCLVGLASRVLPDLVPTARNVSNERLAYPLTYWNALGMLAALGLLACFHIAAAEREPRAARVLGAAAVPGLAVTLFFTFSRGAIAVLVIALAVYAVVGRPRGLLSAVLATVPASVVALIVAYGADMLATENPTAPSAAGQANRVALVTGIAIAAAALLRLALVRVDARLSAVQVSAGARRAALAGSAAVVVLGAVGTSLAIDAPAKIERHYDRFLEGREVKADGDARRRLTDPANNGRLDHWRVALDASRDDRLKGQGAGTYELIWARDRPVNFVVRDAHSLYLETLAELGVVGVVLLGGALLVLLAGPVRRIRGPDRALYAAIFAMSLAWVMRAGLDWDWEMPVITLWFFAIGGAALARPRGARPLLRRPPRPARVVIGLLALALAVTPGLIYLSQAALDRSTRSFERGDCPRAIDDALASTSILSVRPEPFEVLAYCDVRLGRPELAVRAMEEAVERDPQAWRLRYGLALVRGAAGRDPRSAARSALRLNPRSPLARDAIKRFRTSDRRTWKRRALGARLPTE